MSAFGGALPIDFGQVFGKSSPDLGAAAGIGKAGKGGGLGGMIGLASGAMGLASAGLNYYGGLQAQKSARSIADAKMAAARDRLSNEIMMARDAAKFSEGSKIGDRVAAYGYGRDLDFGRQLQAGRIQRGEFADMDYANTMRSLRGVRDFKLDPASEELERRASQRRIKESLAKQLAAGRGMFGPIAPVDVSSMFA